MKKNSGFTLIELIITLGILSILILPLSNLFVKAAITNKISNEKMEATLLAQRMMEGIKSLEEVNEKNLKDMFSDIRFDYNLDHKNVGSYIPSNDYYLIADIDITENSIGFESGNDYFNDIKNNAHIIVKEIGNNKFEVTLKGHTPPTFGPHDDRKIVVDNKVDLKLERKKNKGILYINNGVYEEKVHIDHLRENTINLLTYTDNITITNNFSGVIFNSANYNDYNNSTLKLYYITIRIYDNGKNDEIEFLRGSLMKNEN